MQTRNESVRANIKLHNIKREREYALNKRYRRIGIGNRKNQMKRQRCCITT